MAAAGHIEVVVVAPVQKQAAVAELDRSQTPVAVHKDYFAVAASAAAVADGTPEGP